MNALLRMHGDDGGGNDGDADDGYVCECGDDGSSDGGT